MSELSKKEVNYLARKLYKAVKLVNDTTFLLQEVTSDINAEKFDKEDMKMIALEYKKVSKKNPIEYMELYMHDSFYANMDNLMDKINEIFENENEEL